MQQFIRLQPTPSDHPLNDAQPTTTQDDFIHNFSSIEWHDTEPTNPTPTLLHLLTLTGHLVVAHYDPTHTWGQHFIAWAPLSDTPLQLH